MRKNSEIVKAAKREQILGEYELIKAKKSKLGRSLRDRVTAQALRYLAYDEEKARREGKLPKK